MQEVGAHEEEEDEGGRGVGRDEEEGKPAAMRLAYRGRRVLRWMVVANLRRQNIVAGVSIAGQP